MRILSCLSARLFPPLAVLAMTAACVGAPELGAPPRPRAAGDIASVQSLAGEAAAQWPADNWWTTFGDPQLTALIEEGLAHSPDMAAATARLRKAAALAQVAGAASLPSLGAQGSASLRKDSYNYGFPKEFLTQGWQDYGDMAGVAGLDLDIWGRNRAALAAATSDRRAALLDAAYARLVLAAGIAWGYADLQRLVERRDVARSAIAMRQASQKLVNDRSDQGLEAVGGRRLSLAQTANAQADLAAIEQELAVRRNQLAALVGAGPDRGLLISDPALAPSAALGLPAGATTDLVGRRADVVAARERVEAAASRIKAARADFFPSLRLEALVGVQSLGMDALFRSGSTYGRAGPAISLPLFRGGELKGRFGSARADFDLAVADYDARVLAAYQQVADAVSARRFVVERLALARTAQEASKEAYGVALLRYRGGLSTYNDVLVVEDRVIQASRTTSDIEGAARQADIALIRALGGGFAAADSANAKELRNE
jgi:NodT family efflux transporter outer membrane factor (OMF) lipoprotein